MQFSFPLKGEININNNLLLENEFIKQINGLKDYYVSNLGNIFSYKNSSWRKLKPYLDSRNKYLCIKLQGKHFLVHRLVAQTFIPNPKNLPEVNHKDKNTKNPVVDNLEWCSRVENLKDSYSTLSPARNNNCCELYVDNVLINSFSNIQSACHYAKENYNASFSSLSKYLKWKNIYIITLNNSREIKNNFDFCKSYNKNSIKLYKDNVFIEEFKNFSALSQYYFDKFNISVSADCLRSRYNHNRIIDGYEIKR